MDEVSATAGEGIATGRGPGEGRRAAPPVDRLGARRRWGLVLAILPMFAAADWYGAVREWSPAPEWSPPAPAWRDDGAPRPDGFAPWSGPGGGYPGAAASNPPPFAPSAWEEGRAPVGLGWPGGYRFRPDDEPALGRTGADVPPLAPPVTPWRSDPAGAGGYRFRDQGVTPDWKAGGSPRHYRFRPLTEQEQNGRRGAGGAWRPSTSPPDPAIEADGPWGRDGPYLNPR
ncbi:hypothetical protein [Thiococcus pfennigii]|uniref:hypothetical protein n=1 Tax=Thiococcus pfennigii TaxID=1057 RepID=UPI001908469F|nr:hypothetical protein [Thiococcus pfennigii]MBK1732463.1 hypothetical protein [Thiococcus pfennigii]